MACIPKDQRLKKIRTSLAPETSLEHQFGLQSEVKESKPVMSQAETWLESSDILLSSHIGDFGLSVCIANLSDPVKPPCSEKGQSWSGALS